MAGIEEGGSEGRRTLAVVVIGHVDHGKTALVRALTGMETDRLQEEIARGMSITLGYAWRDYPTVCVDFIDAPGHEDFIRAMAMGASGAAAALLVVSAVEGFGRQTREHLQIAERLGVTTGVVAVAKVDLLSDDAVADVAERVRLELRDTVLAGAPVVFCSARSGAGLEQLHAELQAVAAATPTPAPGPLVLPLDRVFVAPGAGVVATGTLQGRALSTGDELVLQPSGRRVSVRGLQVHGRAVSRADPGGRVAVNLRGATLAVISVGDVLHQPGALEASAVVDVEIDLADAAGRPLGGMEEVRVHWGARQDVARVRPIGGARIEPGERRFARLQFRTPAMAWAGQRGVIRRLSPAATVAGFVVLDPAAPATRGRREGRAALLTAARDGDLDAVVHQLAERDRGALDLAEAARLARRTETEVERRLLGEHAPLESGRWAALARVEAAERAYLARLIEAHAAAPVRLWAPVATIRGAVTRTVDSSLVALAERRLFAEGRIRLSGAGVALSEHDPVAQLSPAARARLDAIEQAHRAGGATPPGRGDLPESQPGDEALVDLLVELGRLVPLRNVALRQTVVFHIEAFTGALEALKAAFPPPTRFTTGEARAALGTSRKFIVPLLEHLDARGETAREGDVRFLPTAKTPSQTA
jgi:selenocysteine-specific elongation factor